MSDSLWLPKLLDSDALGQNETTPTVVGQLLRAIGGWTAPSGRGLL